MNQTFMKERPIVPLVLTMSLPMVLSMLVNALYNIIDSYFVAKISEDAMTALSLVFPIQNIIGAVSIGFGVGVNAAVAFYLGAQEEKKATQAGSLGILLGILHGVLLTGICLAVIPAFLRLYTHNEQILYYGGRYSLIVFSASVIVSVQLVYEKLFQATGRMKVSMYSMMAGCITNIILDPILIFGYLGFPAMGIDGAAIATDIGQAVALVIYLAVYARGRMGLHLDLKEGWQGRHLAGRLYSVGIPATLNQGLPSVLITALNGILAAYGETSVFILGVYYKLQTFIYLTANGIVQGIRPLVGYNYGAREMDRVAGITRTALWMSASVMAVGMIICLAFPRELMGMFTTHPGTIRTGAEALRIISLGFLISSVPVTVSGALEGMGRGPASLVVCMLRFMIVIIPVAYILSRTYGATGVWHAFWINEWICALLSGGLFLRVYQKAKEEPQLPE